VLLYAVLKVDSSKVAEAVEGACRANRGAAVKVLVAAVVEAFLNRKFVRMSELAEQAGRAEVQPHRE
jgi:hypothetical protein